MRLNHRKWPSQHVAKPLIILLLGVICFAIFGIAEAAKPDRTPPAAPTSLRALDVTASTVSLAWNGSTDNVGVTGYEVYQNSTKIGSVSSTQYIAINLIPGTSYSFYVKARDGKGNLSASSNKVAVVTAAASTADQLPVVGILQVSPIASDNQTVRGTVTLSVTASDDKGISKVEFYSNNGSYLIRTLTAPPYSVSWATDPWVPDGEQTLKAVVYDTANQDAQVSRTVIVKNTAAPAPPSGYRKVGYYSSWSTYSDFQVANVGAGMLTHINYAFANISAGGKIALGDSWADVEQTFPGDADGQPFYGNFNQLKKLKQQYPHLRTLISVGGWTWSEKFSDVALTEQSRAAFADSCLQFMMRYGFDGVDLDWEYPVSGGEPDNVRRPEDKQNYTLLLKKLRETFNAQSAKDGKKYWLTITGAADKAYAAKTELNLIQQDVDYINMMTYDFHGAWDPLTGMNAPLYRDPGSSFSAEWSVQDAVQTYLGSGVPANKIVMGVPFYGRAYHQANNANNGLYQPFAGGGSAISYGKLDAGYVNKNGFVRYWEPDSKVPWLFNGSTFISYDDAESIGHKTGFIKSMGLGGAMIWELSQDPDRVLLSKLYHDLQS